jgi:hypothetical protein
LARLRHSCAHSPFGVKATNLGKNPVVPLSGMAL